MVEDIKNSKEKFNEMKEELERMQETIEVLNEKDTLNKLISAINRIESGDYLTKEEI